MAQELPVYATEATNGSSDMLAHAGAREIYLLGDATHGTREFYLYRQRITRELITHFGVDHLVLELGWDEATSIDDWLRHVEPSRGGAGDSSAVLALQNRLQRWPQWLWANQEVAGFMEWLRSINRSRPERTRVRIVGMDLQGTGTDDSEYYEGLNRVNPYAAWNFRARHMGSVVADIVRNGGRVVVWAHNNHVGDKSADDVKGTGLISVGQLLREQFDGGNVFILGSATYLGTFIASERWGGEPYISEIHPSIPGSLASLLAETVWDNPLLYWENEEQKSLWGFDLYHRGIGVVRKPNSDDLDTYVQTRVSRRYDALVFFRHTEPLELLSSDEPRQLEE